MMSKSVSMQSSIHKSPESGTMYQKLSKKMSRYQLQMKEHYDKLDQKAAQIFKKDREIADHLNDWNYCNPENNYDELPMPYKMIDDIIKEGIINQVMNSIGEIEKQKTDPSYDGQLKVLNPSGDIITPKGITAIAEAKGNPSKHLIMGDKFGNLYIFDQSKKSIISKVESLQSKYIYQYSISLLSSTTTNWLYDIKSNYYWQVDQVKKEGNQKYQNIYQIGKRIIHISAVHQRLVDSCLTTIAVIQRATNKVQIFRYIDGENTLTLQCSITVSQQTKTEGLSAADYAFESVLSFNSTYLALLHFSGSVSVYKIPEPPLQQVYVAFDEESQIFVKTEDHIQSSNSFRQSISSPRYEKPGSNYKLPTYTPKDLPDIKPYYVIEFKGKKREKRYDEVMKEIQKSNDVLRSSLLGISVEEMYAQIASKQAALQPQQAQPPPPPVNAKKDVKKPAGKDDKKEEAAKLAQQQQQQQSQQPPEFLKNKEVLFGKDVTDTLNGDISDDIIIPFYHPNLAFLSQKVTFSNKEKQFNRPFTAEIVTGLVITWYNSKNFQYHKLNESNFQNLSQQLQYNYSANDKFQPSLPAAFTPLMTNNFSLIYPITIMEICDSQKYIGFGMKDGNIIIWDNEFQVEKKSMQSHTSSLTCIRFFHEKYLVSGCNNGQVIIHSLEKENNFSVLSNTYKVFKQNAILNIKINKYGLIYVLDSKQNVRTYNLHQQSKIAILEPKLSYDKQNGDTNQVEGEPKSRYQIKWQTTPYNVFHLSKDADQLYILNSEVDQLELEKQTEDEKNSFNKSYKKSGTVQIFKLADNLSMIYESIKNLFRNGIEKDKILFQFTQMSKEDLSNKEYSLVQNTQQLLTENQTIASKKSLLPKLSTVHHKYEKGQKSSSNLKTLGNDISSIHKSGVIKQSLKVPILPTLNQLREEFMSPKSDASSLNSARKSINFRNLSQNQGLTEQKLHPEKYLWKSQYQDSSVFDPLNNTLAQARDRYSRQHLLEQSLSKSMIQLEKNLKTKEEERLATIELEKKRLLRESLLLSHGDKKNKKKKAKMFN